MHTSNEAYPQALRTLNRMLNNQQVDMSRFSEPEIYDIENAYLEEEEESASDSDEGEKKKEEKTKLKLTKPKISHTSDISIRLNFLPE